MRSRRAVRSRGRAHAGMVAALGLGMAGLVASGLFTLDRVAGGQAVSYLPAPPANREAYAVAATVTAAAASAAPAATCRAAERLPIRAALAQTLMLGVTAPSTGELRDLVRGRAPLGGLFLHGDGARTLTDGRLRIAQRAPTPPLLAADDEGGRVQRLEFDYAIPSARTQARTMTPAQVRDLAAERGRALRGYGVTMNLAPVVDVGEQAAGDVIGDRSYSADPAEALRYSRAFAAGLADAGVLPVLKHFPGHGRAEGDSHVETATTPRAAALRKADWKPYRALARSGAAVMMGHLRVPGLSTKGLPSSVDPAVYGVLREEIGFDGLVITDELAAMAAVADRFGLRQSVRRALGAGADMALFLGRPADIGGLLSALQADVRAGRLDAERVREAAGRVLAAKNAC